MPGPSGGSDGGPIWGLGLNPRYTFKKWVKEEGFIPPRTKSRLVVAIQRRLVASDVSISFSSQTIFLTPPRKSYLAITPSDTGLHGER